MITLFWHLEDVLILGAVACHAFRGLTGRGPFALEVYLTFGAVLGLFLVQVANQDPAGMVLVGLIGLYPLKRVMTWWFNRAAMTTGGMTAGGGQ